MDEPAVKKKVRHIVEDMRDVIAVGDIDDRTHGRLCGLARELGRLEAELSDSKLRVAIRSAVNLVLGGLTGYTIGSLADHLGEIVNLL